MFKLPEIETNQPPRCGVLLQSGFLRAGHAPWLHLEYMPEGSVDDQLEAGRFFSRYECKQILAETSDALAYLHTLDP